MRMSGWRTTVFSSAVTAMTETTLLNDVLPSVNCPMTLITSPEEDLR